MSTSYYSPQELDGIEGAESLTLYQFGDRCVSHYFCRKCGICPFIVIAGLPADYDGPARVGDYRINLGCVHELDMGKLQLSLIDGRSF